MPYKDPVKRREQHSKYMREVWYPKNRDKHILAVKPRKQQADLEIRNFLFEYKQSRPCPNCGESDPVCLDFHHLDPTIKEFNVTQPKGRSLEKIKAEISKCVVICSNCHRKLHAGQEIRLVKQGGEDRSISPVS